jgi:peroxiredoxin
MDGINWMPFQNTIKNVRKFLPVLFVLATLLSACSGENLSQAETAQMVGQLQAQQSLPQQNLAKQAQTELQPGEPLDGGSQTPLSTETELTQSQTLTDQAAEVASVESAPVQALEVAPAPAAASLKAAPAVDLSIPVEPKIGFRAPDFTLQTLSGETVRLSDLVGRPVVISYWTTWCIPCQNELPILQQLFQEFQSQGLTVVTINAIDQDSVQDVQTMVGEKGMTMPVLLDQGDQFASAYGALFFPTTIFVDASGVIRYIRLGDSSEADLRTKVENLLAGSL